jgi:hypothetical protein
MEFEHAVAAGRAVGEVGFNALIVATLIDHALISSALIVDTLISHGLIGDALMLVTLGRIRSRTGSSNPVVFNLSTAQMLRLFSHWTHISLI